MGTRARRNLAAGERELYDRTTPKSVKGSSNRLDDQEQPVDDDGRAICGHRVARTGKPCHNWAGQRTTHPGHGRCNLHGGSVGTVVTKAAKQQAASLAVTYGSPVPISADEALEEELHRTVGHVRWLGEVIATLEDGPGVVDQLGRREVNINGRNHALIWGKTKSEAEVHDGDDKSGGSYVMTKETYEAGANIWLRMYMAERAHLLQVSRTTIAAGLEQRRLDWAERVATQMTNALEQLAIELGKDPEDPKVRGAMASALELVASVG